MVCGMGQGLKKMDCFYHFYFLLLFQRRLLCSRLSGRWCESPEAAAPSNQTDSCCHGALCCISEAHCTCLFPAPRISRRSGSFHISMQATGLESRVFDTGNSINCEGLSEESRVGLART